MIKAIAATEEEQNFAKTGGIDMADKKQPDLQLQSMIDSHSNPFVLVDKEYNIVAANKAYCESYGTTDDKVVGCKCHMVSHHFDTPCFMNNENCPLTMALETNKVFEVLHIHFDQHNQPEHVRIKGHPILGVDGRRYIGEEIIRLAKASELDCEEQDLIGKSPAFRECIEGLTRAAEADANVLLTGESGVGKNLAASYIHNRSHRKGRSFTVVDCSTINESIFESELFGHERGAFAGCVGRRRGLLDEADGGTLFLDKVGELPLVMQDCLLNTIETGKYRRVGGRELLNSNVRLIASTHNDLPAMITDNTFSSELYYHIAGISHRIPALRERREDIPALADALLVRLSGPRAYRCHIDKDAKALLTDHDYPGNIRELKNILQRAVSLSTDGHIKAKHIKFHEAPAAEKPAAKKQGQSIKQMEAERISELLVQHQGHRRIVADELGISERTLYRKLEKYNLTDTGKTG
ncbi:MAG: sigma 54-interacting transcriptional regulator [Gammaproteobacteria bacterium]|nr:sigma 54-interacting transcriptional regulator [Gammaproteobacteria bacterium]